MSYREDLNEKRKHDELFEKIKKYQEQKRDCQANGTFAYYDKDNDVVYCMSKIVLPCSFRTKIDDKFGCTKHKPQYCKKNLEERLRKFKEIK